MALILGLLVLGFLLLGAEVFLPGVVVGICGVLALGAATVLCYSRYGVQAGNLLLSGLAVAGLVATVWWVIAFPHTSVARRMTLTARVGAGEPAPHVLGPDLVGAAGEAAGDLRPAGTVRVHGQRLEAVTEGGWLEAGTPVTVVRVEARRVVVRAA